MAQSDLTIQNQSFPSFRSDLNDALSAINSFQSGTSTPASAVVGTIWLDITNATTPTLKYYDGTDNISLATLDHASNTVNWLDSTVAFDIINDITPSLGGMLDVNGQAIGDGTLELIKFAETASAVNEITVTNSATGTAPEISATGDDTDVDLKVTPKGAGNLILDGFEFPNTDGTAGQVLQTDGYANLSFATPSGGKVLQVIHANTSTQVANSTGTLADTTLTATITPSSASNKILVLVSQNGLFRSNGNQNNALIIRLFRDATEIGRTGGLNFINAGATLITSITGTASFNVLDTPSSTSAITYKTQFFNVNGTAEVGVQYTFGGGWDSTSYITLMEIAG
jgi:hypothetical protein